MQVHAHGGFGGTHAPAHAHAEVGAHHEASEALPAHLLRTMMDQTPQGATASRRKAQVRALCPLNFCSSPSAAFK